MADGKGVEEVAPGVFTCRGTHVNWVLLREGRELTLVDGGWYGDAAGVERSIRAIGCRPEDVRAVLLTHAHIDHLGALGRLHERHGVPAFTHPREVPHARREFLEQASPVELVKRLGCRGMARWVLRIVAAGGLRRLSVPFAEPFPRAGALDLPGRPVPVPCPGHTSGHTAYHVPSAGVLVAGDALVTGHPVTRPAGPQLLPGYFTHDAAEALHSLDALAAVDADMLVPGHGDPWRGDLREAVALARDRATAAT